MRTRQEEGDPLISPRPHKIYCLIVSEQSVESEIKSSIFFASYHLLELKAFSQEDQLG